MGTNFSMQCYRYVDHIQKYRNSKINFIHETGTYRDETAPIAVGSALAIVTLCSVTAYGIWRYAFMNFKYLAQIETTINVLL